MLTTETSQTLVQAAMAARHLAYAPYSNYQVGAALLTASGKIYTGVNIENAAYPTGICAERVALFKAVSEGERQFLAVAVVTENGGSPCGACRQALSEFGVDLKVWVADAQGQLHSEWILSDLLPGAFGPHHLSPSTSSRD